MNTPGTPHHTISTEAFAEWLDRQSESWWIVDGDLRLTREVDFPCPSDELAEALRDHHVPLVVKSSGWIGPDARNQRIPETVLEDLPRPEGRQAARAFQLSWEDGGDEWMLCEYLPVTIDR